MRAFLKNHPFAVEAFFETSLVLTYAVPVQQLARFIPTGLQADTLHNTWGFVAIAMVKTKALRPKGFPGFMGNDFFLIGYRIFVTCRTAGKRLRGLYILRSETDSARMTRLGNIFTHYQYTTTDIQHTQTAETLTVQSNASQLNIMVSTSTTETRLPPGSPFADWKEARRFAGPLPFTFTPLPEQQTFLVIEGVRRQWVPQPVQVLHHEAGFLKTLALQDAVLANAFSITNVPYYWKKGRKISCTP